VVLNQLSIGPDYSEVSVGANLVANIAEDGAGINRGQARSYGWKFFLIPQQSDHINLFVIYCVCVWLENEHGQYYRQLTW